MMKKRLFLHKTTFLLLTLAIIGVAVALFLYIQHTSVVNKPTVITSGTIDLAEKNPTVAVQKKDQPKKTVLLDTAVPLQAKPQEIVEYTPSATTIKKDANAAVLLWEQDGHNGAELRVRTKNNDRWTEWQEVHPSDDRKDNTEEPILASAIILASNIDEFEYKITLTGSNTKPSASINVTSTKLVTIDSKQGKDGSRSMLQNISSFFNPTAQAGSYRTPPNVISRADWGSPEVGYSEWIPEYSKLGRAIVHHTATTESSDSYADVRAIWFYHTKTLGWGDIGYHYLVDSHGKIFEGRHKDKEEAKAKGLEVIGGHAYGSNVGTIGVSILGDYRTDTLSTASREAVAHIIGYSLASVKINPAENGPFGRAVVGHYHVYPTSCPGKNVIDQLPTIRARAQDWYRTYLPMFDYEPLGGFSWYTIKDGAYKIDPQTKENIYGPYSIDGQKKFLDKITVDSVTYYRTAHDALNNRQYGFSADDLVRPASAPFSNPRYMKLVRDSYKTDPVTSEVYSSFAKDTTALFVEKITINGQHYYKTQTDGTQGNEKYFPAKDLTNAVFVSLDEPVYRNVAANTNVYNVQTGAVVRQTTTPESVAFASRIKTNTEYYRTQDDTTANQPYGIKTSDLRDTLYQPLATTEQKWYRLSEAAPKYNPFTQEIVSSPTPKDVIIRVNDSVTVDGTQYYRTAHDAERDNAKAFSGASLVPVEATPLSQAINYTTTAETATINPLTEEIGQPIAANTPVQFSSTIQTNKKYYVVNSVSGIQAVEVDATSLESFAPVSSGDPVYGSLNKDTAKYNLDTAEKVAYIKQDFVRSIQLSDTIYVNDIQYYRTYADKDKTIPYGIPVRDVDIFSIDYQRMSTPRFMSAKVDLKKEDLYSGRDVDGTLKKDQRIFFDTKVVIDGKLYLRTAHDSNNQYNKGIPFELLKS